MADDDEGVCPNEFEQQVPTATARPDLELQNLQRILDSAVVVRQNSARHKSRPRNNVTGISTCYSFQTHSGFWRGTGPST